MLQSKELFAKVCERCEKTFRTDKEDETICPVCKRKEYQKEYREQHKDKAKEYREQHKANKKFHRVAPGTVPIREFTAIIEKYNTQHGTHYTYGQFVCLVHNKKIIL